MCVDPTLACQLLIKAIITTTIIMMIIIIIIITMMMMMMMMMMMIMTMKTIRDAIHKSCIKVEVVMIMYCKK